MRFRRSTDVGPCIAYIAGLDASSGDIRGDTGDPAEGVDGLDEAYAVTPSEVHD